MGGCARTRIQTERVGCDVMNERESSRILGDALTHCRPSVRRRVEAREEVPGDEQEVRGPSHCWSHRPCLCGLVHRPVVTLTISVSFVYRKKKRRPPRPRLPLGRRLTPRRRRAVRRRSPGWGTHDGGGRRRRRPPPTATGSWGNDIRSADAPCFSDPSTAQERETAMRSYVCQGLAKRPPTTQNSEK